MKKSFLLLPLFLVFCFLGTTSIAIAYEGQGNVVGSDIFANIAEKNKDAVVNISIVGKVQPRQQQRRPGRRGQQQDPFQDFFERFYGAPPQQQQQQPRKSLGTGFVIDSSGYIITNNHVIDNADEITVSFSNEKEYKAKIIGIDPKTDIALIKVEADEKLPHVEFGDSDALRVGEWVMAIGNPFGLSSTVTVGVVSAKSRVIGSGPYDNFIQTDASINPGNSGGPLFNTEGKVVGINSAIYSGGSGTPGNIGIGFAIPINMAAPIISDLKSSGTVTRGYLGVMIQRITPELADSLGLKKAEGALVSGVVKDSPAEKGGIKRGDLIRRFNGKNIKHSEGLPREVAKIKPGNSVPLVVVRNGKDKKLTVTIGKLKDEAALAQVEEKRTDLLGVSVEEIDPELARQYGFSAEEGVMINAVVPGGNAHAAGLREGDILLEVNQMVVNSLGEYAKALTSIDNRKAVLLVIKRRGQVFFVSVSLKK